MGRLVGLLVVVAAVWLAVTVYTEGVDRAFGGIFSGFAASSAFDAPADRSTPDRAADAFQRAYNTSEERVQRLLDQPGAQ